MANKRINDDENPKEELKSKNKSHYKKGRKSRKQYSAKPGKDERVLDRKEGGNDPRWWGEKGYVEAVGRFSFANALGQPVPWSFTNDPLSTAQISMSSNAAAINTIAGVMAIDVLPTLGVCQYQNDPMNVYLRSFYSKLRSTNNQSAPYAAPDIGIYLLGIDSVHMAIEQLIRMYGVARTYSPLNRYLPEALLWAMGINPHHATYDLYANLANFRAQILSLMVKIQTLCIPKGININERHRQLVRYVYSDAPVTKSQTYLFRTPYLYKYNPTYNESGGGLVATAVPPAGSSASAWVSFVDNLIDAIIGDVDFQNISGDIQKSFGFDAMFGMPYFDEVYSVVPLYNPEILLEIHNMKVCGDRFTSTAFDIYQSVTDNSLVSTPYCGTTGATAGPVNCLIDIPMDFPDADSVMIATRLATVGPYTYDTTSNTFKFVPHCLGTEMVTGLTIWDVNASGAFTSHTTQTNVASSNGSTLSHTSILNIMGRESCFDWHPHFYLAKYDSTGNIEFYGIVSEISDYTIIEVAQLSKLHEIALMGALTVDGLDTVGLHERK